MIQIHRLVIMVLKLDWHLFKLAQRGLLLIKISVCGLHINFEND
jgi:hypothetical protein